MPDYAWLDETISAMVSERSKVNPWKNKYDRLREDYDNLFEKHQQAKAGLTQVEVRAMLNTVLVNAGLPKLSVGRNNNKNNFIAAVSTDLHRILSPKDQFEDVLAE